eukprot:6202922-Pleurochrysis_carterae.AAC.1
MYYLIQTLAACEESTLKVKERCVSLVCQERVLARARLSDKVGRSPQEEKPRSQRGQNNLAEGYAGGEKRGRGGRKKTEELDGAGGVCARGPVARVNARRAGRLLATSASLLSIDERLSSAPARPNFRSSRSPPRC